MNEYQEHHRRILKLIHAQRWECINSADESTLQTLLLTGMISESAEPLGSTPRLHLTFDGRRYLTWLNAR